jgi:hypothetical protein
MTDFIGSAPDLETFQAAAQALGFTDDEGNILTNGRWPDSSGSWFLNVVGEVPDQAGFWVRLRWNEGSLGGRQTQFLSSLRALGITIYEQTEIDDGLVWSTDGETPADAWIDGVGVIL